MVLEQPWKKDNRDFGVCWRVFGMQAGSKPPGEPARRCRTPGAHPTRSDGLVQISTEGSLPVSRGHGGEQGDVMEPSRWDAPSQHPSASWGCVKALEVVRGMLSYKCSQGSTSPAPLDHSVPAMGSPSVAIPKTPPNRELGMFLPRTSLLTLSGCLSPQTQGDTHRGSESRPTFPMPALDWLLLLSWVATGVSGSRAWP